MCFQSAAARDENIATYGSAQGAVDTTNRLAAHLVTMPTERDFVISREYEAPRALVWQAFTEARQLARWWGPAGFRLSHCEVEPRVVSAPQGAPFYVMRGASDEKSPACDPDRAGHGAWHELHAADGPKATDFYSAQFGWCKARGVDMGPMGTYQLIAICGRDLGGIMTDARFPRPAWLVYFRVDGIERAARRIVEAGGQVSHGPMEVPGGGWIVNGLDPEGEMFALTGTQ